MVLILTRAILVYLVEKSIEVSDAKLSGVIKLKKYFKLFLGKH